MARTWPCRCQAPEAWGFRRHIHRQGHADVDFEEIRTTAAGSGGQLGVAFLLIELAIMSGQMLLPARTNVSRDGCVVGRWLGMDLAKDGGSLGADRSNCRADRGFARESEAQTPGMRPGLHAQAPKGTAAPPTAGCKRQPTDNLLRLTDGPFRIATRLCEAATPSQLASAPCYSMLGQ